MNKPPIRRILLALIVVALLAIFVPPLFNLNSYRNRITQSLQEGLGRPVSVESVSLRLLPQPGFDLKNVVISDDPAFGAEPMLRAPEVTAGLRLRSLWRRRLEIARLSFTSPSLNLVRSSDGRWNLEALLERATQTPSAPTGQKRADARPRFPYIQADEGRINFKIGQEKRVFTLSEAEFALWLGSEDEWSFRLQARPLRTDFNLGDTGRMKLNGRFHRAADLHSTPLEITASLEGAQLGQLTTLVYGYDRGWRGAVEISGKVSGTPGSLDIRTHAGIRDFRRYDIDNTESLRLDATCAANYNHGTKLLSGMDCQLPLEKGNLRLRGSMTGVLEPRAYDLTVAAQDIGVQTLAVLARRAKKDVPADLQASGSLNGTFAFRKAETDVTGTWTGEGSTSDIVLRSSVLTPELALPPVTFSTQAPAPEKPQKHARHHVRTPLPQQPQVARVMLARFRAPLGAGTPADVSGWINGDGYQIDVQGDSRIPRLLQIARALGLQGKDSQVEGTARLDLHVVGKWAGFATPLTTGTAQLQNVTAPIRGVNYPLQLSSANLVLAADGSTLQNFTAKLTGSPVQFGGWIRMGRNCDTLQQCPIQFDLQTNELSADALNHLLNPSYVKKAWYNVFGGSDQKPALMMVQAKGNVSVGRMSVGTLVANRVTAQLQLASGKLRVMYLRAEVLGGKHSGEWQADFNGPVPVYTGVGSLSGTAMTQLAALMRDNWAAGAIDARYNLTLSGLSTDDLSKSAKGVAEFTWRNGTLRHLTLNGNGTPLQFRHFGGYISLKDEVLSLGESKMAGPGSIYVLSGTASMGRQLGLKLRDGNKAYTVSGSLEKPKIAPIADQQVSLKR